MRTGPVIATLVGLAGGVVVTRDAHRKPRSPWWDVRVASTRLRRSDLPVGGTLFGLVALARRGHRDAGWIGGLALGAAAGAVGTGLLEPLPPA